MPFEFDIVTAPLESLIPAPAFADARAGGVCCFQGIIRNHNEGQAVKSLEYEADIPLGRAEAARILEEARRRFDIIGVKALHRIGHLQIGETAIWVAANAAHRQAAFDAVQYVVHEIKHRLPIWKKEHYVAGGSQWVSCHHREKPDLDPKVYYSRQTNLSLIGEKGQSKLGQARILVVGAGGLGAHVLTHLVASGVGTVGICEHDTLALHNLHRQTLYTINDLGHAKATAAKERLSRINPFVDIHLHPAKLTADNIHDTARSYDLIIDGTDNFATKFLLNDYCVLYRKPLIQASVYQLEGQMTFYRPVDDAACLRCTWPVMPEPDCVGNCQQAGVMGFTPGMIGTWQAAEAIKHCLDLPTLSANQTLLINLLTNKTQTLKQPRRIDCPVCGESPSITIISGHHYQSSFEIDPENISIRDLSEFTLVDIRKSDERTTMPFPEEAEHLHLPQQTILAETDILKADQKYLLICAAGLRSLKTATALQDMKKNNVYSLKNGIPGLQSIVATRA